MSAEPLAYPALGSLRTAEQRAETQRRAADAKRAAKLVAIVPQASPPRPALVSDPGADLHQGTAVPSAWSAVDLMAATFAEPRWAVPGVIVSGLTLLAGAPKLGKSWLALALTVAVSSGGRALGKVKVEQGEALYLALEDTPRRLQSRLGIVLEGDPPPAGLTFATDWPVFPEGGADQLDQWLDAHPSCRLVAVDVLARIRGTVSERENAYAADYRAMVKLKDLADDHDCAIVVVHHTRKAASEDFLDTVSGTNGLAAAADTIAVLSRSRGSADATLNITGRDVDEAKIPLSLTGGVWTMLDGPADDYDLGDTRRAILHLLRDEEALTPKVLAERLGIKEATARQTCRRMVDAGQLDTDGAGHYMVPLSPVTPVTPVTPPDPHDEVSDTASRHLSLETPPLTRESDTSDRSDREGGEDQ